MLSAGGPGPRLPFRLPLAAHPCFLWFMKSSTYLQVSQG